MGEERITGPGWRTEQEWRRGADWQGEPEEGGMTVQAVTTSYETEEMDSDYSGDEIDSEAGLVTCGKLILNPSTMTSSSDDIIPGTEPLYENFPHPIAGIENMEALTKSEEDLLEKIAANPIPDLDTDWEDPEEENDSERGATNTEISDTKVCEEVSADEYLKESKVAEAPVVDIVVVEKVGVDSLDMVSRMIELGDSGSSSSSPGEEEEEEGVDPRYVIKSIEKIADEDFEAVFEANFCGDPEIGLSEEDIKALGNMGIEIVAENVDLDKRPQSTEPIQKFQDAIENYTKAVFSDHDAFVTNMDNVVDGIHEEEKDKEDKANTNITYIFNKVEEFQVETFNPNNPKLEQLAQDIAHDIICDAREEARDSTTENSKETVDKEDNVNMAHVEKAIETVNITPEEICEIVYENDCFGPKFNNATEDVIESGNANKVVTDKKEIAAERSSQDITIERKTPTEVEDKVPDILIQNITEKSSCQDYRNEVVEEIIVLENAVITISDFEQSNMCGQEEIKANDTVILRPSEVSDLLGLTNLNMQSQKDNIDTLLKPSEVSMLLDGSCPSPRDIPDQKAEDMECKGPDKSGETLINRVTFEKVEEVAENDEQAEDGRNEKGKGDDGRKKESVAECLRRYRMEEDKAKARRAEQLRRKYTLLEEEEVTEEVEQVFRKDVKTKQLQQKLLVAMVLSGLAILLLLISWCLNTDEESEAADCPEEVPAPRFAPSVLWDYIQYSDLAEQQLRK